MPLIVLICGLLFAVFALIAPDIAWPLFTAVLISTLAVMLFVVALWLLMIFPGWDVLRPSGGRG